MAFPVQLCEVREESSRSCFGESGEVEAVAGEAKGLECTLVQYLWVLLF